VNYGSNPVVNYGSNPVVNYGSNPAGNWQNQTVAPPPSAHPNPASVNSAMVQSAPYPSSPSPYPMQPQSFGSQAPLPPQVAWKWTYSGWIGIMYGPVPVGIILGIIVLIAIYASK
jgi:hypothetical protein